MAQVENLDPAQRDRVGPCFNPKGFGPVASSRNFVYIISHALRGFDHGTIARLLEIEKGEIVPATAIRDYMVEHIPPDLLRPHLLIQYMQKQPAMTEIETLDLLRKLAVAQLMMQLDEVGSIADQAVRVDCQERIQRSMELTRRLAETSLRLKIDQRKAGVIDKSDVIDVDVEQTSIFDLQGNKYEIDERQAAVAYHLMKDLGLFKPEDEEVSSEPDQKRAAAH
jgi:hypothetical protein